jgi:ferredoxin-NADP reductase
LRVIGGLLCQPGQFAARRVDAEMLAEVTPAPAKRPRFYACGPTPFVEAVAEALVQLGHDPRAIKTERFGPTGR